MDKALEAFNKIKAKLIKVEGNTTYGSIMDLTNLDIIEIALKEYKAIEDMLGIDLVTLYKVLEQGIYYKDMYYTGDDKLYITNGEIYNYARDRWVYLKDYGKTWALTKEELK